MTYGKSLTSIWRWCFAITLIGFVVQMIPLVGLISLLLLTPYWPTLFLNAAFAVMAIDALIGCKNPKLLIGPIVWFGGYALAAGISHAEVYMMSRTAAKMNEHRVAPWDKATQALQINNSPMDSNWGSDLRSEGLISSYNVDEVWSGRGWTRLSRESCPGTMDADIVDGVTYGRIWRGRYPSKGPMQSANDICLLFGEGTPPSKVVSVAAREINYRNGLVEGISQDFDIAAPDLPPFTIRSVTVAPLPWIPVPVAGCHFKGGFGDQWDSKCHAYFDHLSWRANKDATPLKVVARALGLREASIEERMPFLTWTSIGRNSGRPSGSR
jgi:hypothetical protein